ncbi:MAG: Mur ligase family protein [Opitutaceae bacterium]
MIGYLVQNRPLIHAFQPTTARRTRAEAVAAGRIFRRAPKLADCFVNGEVVDLKGTLDRPFSGLAVDSRRVSPGALFFALPGLRDPGAASVDEAVSRGAVAVVTQKIPAFPPAKVTFIRVADVRATLARVAQRHGEFPDQDLALVAVTGAHGKTSVAHLLKHFLHGGRRVGLLGSINYDLGSRVVPALGRALQADDVFGMMAQMRAAGCGHAVLELGARGVDPESVRGIKFAAAVFTSADHEGQLGAPAKISAVNLDDPAGEALAVTLTARGATRVVSYGENLRAMVRAENVFVNLERSSLRLVWPGGAMDVSSPLIGRAHVSNLLAAVAVAWALGGDPAAFLAELGTFPGVCGRLERAKMEDNFHVVIDSARTEKGMRHTLAALRAITPGRLLVVFGAGDDAERAARPALTRAVQQFADFAVGTADNARHEPIAQIFDDLRTGVVHSQRITWIGDRRYAIAVALSLARPGDCVVITGKGHERWQKIGGTVCPFDDRQVVRECLTNTLARAGT